MTHFKDQTSPYTAENMKRGSILVTAEESPYSDRPVPWDGLGAEVGDRTTLAGMMKAAGLNWTVEKHQLRDDTGPVPKFAMRRSDTNAYLDTVGNTYVPTQNADAFKMFEKFLDKKARMSIAGVIGGGRYVWALADLGTAFELRGQDEVKGYLLVAVPHIQGKKVVFKYTNIRRQCNNMLTSALRQVMKGKGGERLGEYRHSHRTEFTLDTFNRASEMLGIARDQHEAFGETAKLLQKKKMGADDIYGILQPVFAPDLTIDEVKERKITPRLRQLLDINREAPGAQEDNAWGLLNAVSYYTTHVQGKTQDRRLQQMWVGKAGNQVDDVQRRLIAA